MTKLLGGILLVAACASCVSSDDDEDGSGSRGPTTGPVRPCSDDDECDDGIACTRDHCALGVCAAVVDHSACPGGACSSLEGCMETRPCADDLDCEDEDPCTVDERCDSSRRTCVYGLLDGDRDGYPPVVCGGVDCDDDEVRVPRPTDADCDGLDNDCDGEADEGLDMQSDPLNCGSCGNACPSGVCDDGACTECGARGGECCALECFGRGVCEPVQSSASGDCQRDDAGAMVLGCFEGICEDCGTEGDRCCPGERCAFGGMVCLDDTCLSCGRPGEICCAATSSRCSSGSVCVEGQCEVCGGAGQACCASDSCDDDLACTDGTCEPCGGPGEACCAGGACDEGSGCIDASCQACGKLGEPCCPDAGCDAGVYAARCVDGQCQARSCGSLPSWGSVACSEPQASCVRACGPDDYVCRQSCAMLDIDEIPFYQCGSCLDADVMACAQTMGCEAEIDAALCCLGDECGSVTASYLVGCPLCDECSACGAQVGAARECMNGVRDVCGVDNLDTSTCLP